MFYGFNSYYYTFNLAPLIQATELIESGKLKKDYIDVMSDVGMVLRDHFTNSTDDSYTPIGNYGKIYTAFLANPTKYIIP